MGNSVPQASRVIWKVDLTCTYSGAPGVIRTRAHGLNLTAGTPPPPRGCGPGSLLLRRRGDSATASRPSLPTTSVRSTTRNTSGTHASSPSSSAELPLRHRPSPSNSTSKRRSRRHAPPDPAIRGHRRRHSGTRVRRRPDDQISAVRSVRRARLYRVLERAICALRQRIAWAPGSIAQSRLCRPMTRSAPDAT